MNTLRTPVPRRWLPLARWLASSGLVGAISFGAGTALVISWLAAGRPDPLLAAIGALLVYASYLIDALRDARTEADAVASQRSRHLRPRRRAVAALGLAAFVLAMGLAARSGGPLAAAGLLVFPASVLGYARPWLPVLKQGRLVRCRLKEVPFAKSTYTSFFWGVFGVYVWCFAGGALTAAACLGAFLLMAPRMALNTVFCDLKDIDRDRTLGIVTPATHLGRERLIGQLTHLNTLWPFALGAMVAFQMLPPLALTLTSVYAHLCYAAAARRWVDDETLCNLVADAEPLFWPVWLALGLLCGLGA